MHCSLRLSRKSPLNRNRVVLAPLLLLMIGCQQKDSTHEALARLDNRTLTAEDIHVRFDSTQGITEAQLQQYVQRWLKDELLYREALARGFGSSTEINDRLEDVRRQLVINEFLDKAVYSEKTASSTPEELQAYYDAHLNEFVLRNDVALISYTVFSNRDAANKFRNTVLRGTGWYDALHQLLNDPKQGPKVLTKGDSLYHSQGSLLPADLWRVASSANLREPSFPISTTEGYYVLIVWRFGKQGQRADIRLVDGEIRNRLAIERRSHLYDSLVANLRTRHSVEVLMGSTVNDTTRLKSLE